MRARLCLPAAQAARSGRHGGNEIEDRERLAGNPRAPGGGAVGRGHLLSQWVAAVKTEGVKTLAIFELALSFLKLENRGGPSAATGAISITSQARGSQPRLLDHFASLPTANKVAHSRSLILASASQHHAHARQQRQPTDAGRGRLAERRVELQ